jgi:hypothetical protein
MSGRGQHRIVRTEPGLRVARRRCTQLPDGGTILRRTLVTIALATSSLVMISGHSNALAVNVTASPSSVAFESVPIGSIAHRNLTLTSPTGSGSPASSAKR